jgi:hypothetical protein
MLNGKKILSSYANYPQPASYALQAKNAQISTPNRPAMPFLFQDDRKPAAAASGLIILPLLL